MEWLNKHKDTVIIVGSICCSLLWMNGSMNSIRKEMNDRLYAIEKDVAIIKTVLIKKGIMSDCLAAEHKK